MNDELIDLIRELTPMISRSGTEIRLACDTRENRERIWDALRRAIALKVSPEAPNDTRMQDLESRIKRLEAWTFGRMTCSRGVMTVFEHRNPDQVAEVVPVDMGMTTPMTKGAGG